jgi:hypothetical protein
LLGFLPLLAPRNWQLPSLRRLLVTNPLLLAASKWLTRRRFGLTGHFSFCRAPCVLTGPTTPCSVSVDHRVSLVERMAMQAMGLACPFGHNAEAVLPGVLPVGKNPKMRWIYAGAISTDVIDHVTLRDWTILHLVRKPMRERIDSGHHEAPVPMVVYVPGPDEASIFRKHRLC